MPAQSIDELPVQADMAGYTARGTHGWGDMSVSYETVSGDAVGMDVAPIFEGLPDGRCQASHYGYQIEGRTEYRFADHVETVEAGQVYYIAPGHIPHSPEPGRAIDFTRTEELMKTVEVAQRNAQRLFGGGGGG